MLRTPFFHVGPVGPIKINFMTVAPDGLFWIVVSNSVATNPNCVAQAVEEV